MPTRIQSIDALRSMAIVKMVVCHFLLYLSNKFSDSAPGLSTLMAYPPGSQFFTFAVGLSFFLSYRSYSQRPNYDKSRYLKRAGALFLVGLLFSLCTWGYESIFDWDILTCIAGSIAILFLVRNLPSPALVLLVLGIVAVAPLLQEWVNFSSFWVEDRSYYISKFEVGYIFSGFFLTGYFPIVPWVAFPIVGLLAGRFFFQSKPETLSSTVLVLIALGVSATLFIELFPEHSSDSYYPLSTFRIVRSLCLTVTVFALFFYLFDLKKVRLPAYFTRLSRYSLTIYLLHHFVIMWPVWIAGLSGEEIDIYFQRALQPWTAFGLSLLFLTIMHPLLKKWDQFNGKFSTEWWLAKVTPNKPTQKLNPPKAA